MGSLRHERHMASLPSDLAARSAADVGRGIFLLLLGSAGMAGVFLAAHVWVFPAILRLTGSETRHLVVMDAILLGIMFLDLLLHPTWVWSRGRRWFALPWDRRREPSEADFDDLWTACAPGRPLGFVKMLPLVAAIFDPHNKGLRKMIFLADIVTIPLFGSRIARNGMEHVRAAGTRATASTVASAEALLKWIRDNGPVAERRLGFQLSIEPGWWNGLALARDLERISRTRAPEGFVYSVR